MPAAIPLFSYPLALKKDTMKGLITFKGMPAAIPLFSCPLALKKDTLKDLVFKECLQQFLYFSYPLALKKDTLKGIVDSSSPIVLCCFGSILQNHV